jgi:hypothetical protein
MILRLPYDRDLVPTKASWISVLKHKKTTDPFPAVRRLSVTPPKADACSGTGDPALGLGLASRRAQPARRKRYCSIEGIDRLPRLPNNEV